MAVVDCPRCLGKTLTIFPGDTKESVCYFCGYHIIWTPKTLLLWVLSRYRQVAGAVLREELHKAVGGFFEARKFFILGGVYALIERLHAEGFIVKVKSNFSLIIWKYYDAKQSGLEVISAAQKDLPTLRKRRNNNRRRK